MERVALFIICVLSLLLVIGCFCTVVVEEMTVVEKLTEKEAEDELYRKSIVNETREINRLESELLKLYEERNLSLAPTFVTYDKENDQDVVDTEMKFELEKEPPKKKQNPPNEAKSILEYLEHEIMDRTGKEYNELVVSPTVVIEDDNNISVATTEDNVEQQVIENEINELESSQRNINIKWATELNINL